MCPHPDEQAVGLQTWGELNKSLRDQYGDRVEIARVRFKTEALCFEWDRAATTEWVDDARQAIGIPTPNLGSCLFESLLVV